MGSQPASILLLYCPVPETLKLGLICASQCVQRDLMSRYLLVGFSCPQPLAAIQVLD